MAVQAVQVAVVAVLLGQQELAVVLHHLDKVQQVEQKHLDTMVVLLAVEQL
jgi:hypothetical protein